MKVYSLRFGKDGKTIQKDIFYGEPLKTSPHPTIFQLRWFKAHEGLEMLPDISDSLKRLHSLALKNNASFEALGYFNHSLSIGDSSNFQQAQTLSARGDTQCILGFYSGAIADYSLASKVQPDYARAHDSLGCLYFDRGKIIEAFISIDKAVSEEPTESIQHNNKGSLLSLMGEYDDAIISLQKAVALDSEYYLSHAHLGYILFKFWDILEVRAITEKLNAFAPARLYQHQLLYLIAKLECDETAAGIHLKTGLEALNNIIVVEKDAYYYNTAKKYHLFKEFDSALRFIQEAVNRNNKAFYIYSEYASIMTSLGRYSKALSLYDKALSKELRLLFGKIYECINN